MDEVLEKLTTTVLDPDNDQNKTSFDGLYKNWGKLGHQDQRRKDILQVQRNNRNHTLDACRGIIELVNAVEGQDSHYNRKAQVNYRPSIYVAGFTKTSASYRNVLMMSEWMVEKPHDFEDNWYVVPCPKGIRTLVVASQGNTKFYNKYGTFRMACRTALPGGNPCDPNHMSQCVILDCFHVESKNTMYILDLLAWNSQPMTDGETEFRHYWMKTHIEDIPALRTISSKNKIIFDILPKVDCDSESFNKFMMTRPHFNNYEPPLDGLLFYHKLTHYVAGVTPLVGWLYPYMVNEVLGSEITVNQGYICEKPADYVNQASFIEAFEARLDKNNPSFMKPPNEEPNMTSEKTNQKKIRHHKNARRQIHDEEMAEAEIQPETEFRLSPQKMNSNQNVFGFGTNGHSKE